MSSFDRLKAEKRRKAANSSKAKEPINELEKGINAYLSWAKETMPEDIDPIVFWVFFYI